MRFIQMPNANVRVRPFWKIASIRAGGKELEWVVADPDFRTRGEAMAVAKGLGDARLVIVYRQEFVIPNSASKIWFLDRSHE